MDLQEGKVYHLLPPPPKVNPSFAPRLLASTTILWNETKLLKRIMYKTKNQHRSTCYYRKFQQLVRSLKNMEKLEIFLQSSYEGGIGDDELEVKSTITNLSKLCKKLQNDCKVTYRILQQLYDEANFVPLTVTTMAMVSRIHQCTKAINQELQGTILLRKLGIK